MAWGVALVDSAGRTPPDLSPDPPRLFPRAGPAPTILCSDESDVARHPGNALFVLVVIPSAGPCYL